MMSDPLLLVKDLVLSYQVKEDSVLAVNNVSFSIDKRGQSLAIVGESGCGKTSLARAILRNLPNNTKEFSGEIWLDGEKINVMKWGEFRRRILWKKVSWVPQGASSEPLNPIYTIGKEIRDTLKEHKVPNPHDETIRLLEAVGLNREHASYYQHRLSGGMLQRVCIAMAIALKPPLIILDEPTSALDVSLQGDIINLLKDLKDESNLSYLFITHNIGIAAVLCDQFAVIYGGRLVERGPTEKVLDNPLHPYTRKLLECVSSLDRRSDRVAAIPGEPPDLRTTAVGCPFFKRPAVRCERCSDIQMPELVEYEKDHFVACHGVVSQLQYAVR